MRFVLEKLAFYLRSIFLFYPFDNILSYFTQGKDEGTLYTRLRPYPERYKKGNIKSIVRNGVNYQVDLSDYLQWRLFYHTINYSEKALFKLIRPEMTIIDIGSNIGELSMNLASLVGKNGTIVSFEPDIDNYRVLKHNLSLNNFDQIQHFNIALSEKQGFGSMFVEDSTNLGMNYLEFGILNSKDKVEVDTLDNFIESNPISNIDLIKIDTEGHELKILKGAKQILLKYHPILFIEVNDRFLERAGDTALELIEFLEDLGYNMLEAIHKTIINSSSNLNNIHFDIIAIHASVYKNL